MCHSSKANKREEVHIALRVLLDTRHTYHIASSYHIYVAAAVCWYRLTLLEPQSRFGEQTTEILSSLPPKRDCSPTRVRVDTWCNVQFVLLITIDTWYWSNWSLLAQTRYSESARKKKGKKQTRRANKKSIYCCVRSLDVS